MTANEESECTYPHDWPRDSTRVACLHASGRYAEVIKWNPDEYLPGMTFGVFSPGWDDCECRPEDEAVTFFTDDEDAALAKMEEYIRA